MDFGKIDIYGHFTYEMSQEKNDPFLVSNSKDLESATPAGLLLNGNGVHWAVQCSTGLSHFNLPPV